MTTLRGTRGVAVLRPNRGDVLVVRRGSPAAVTVLPDPTGALGEVMRACAARDRAKREAR